jgi:SAM-dependent methyltransferase
MTIVGEVHGRFVHTRRVERLSEHLSALMPESGTVLDIGCGDGRLARRIGERRPGLTMRGIDVLVRQDTAIPIDPFDGSHIPLADAAMDIAMLVDVLHHAEDPLALLREAARVARQAVVIKDHLREGIGAQATLRFMDWVGNARFGVHLTYQYWSRDEWNRAIAVTGLAVERWVEKLSLYPLPSSLLFDRSLHFVARLRKA